MKIKDLEKYIEDEMLDEIYMNREDKLYKKCERDRREMEKIIEEYPSDYEAVVKAIQDLTENLQEGKNDIIETLDEFCMREEIYAGYEKEKFYKVGFCDGVKIILESLKVA